MNDGLDDTIYLFIYLFVNSTRIKQKNWWLERTGIQTKCTWSQEVGSSGFRLILIPMLKWVEPLNISTDFGLWTRNISLCLWFFSLKCPLKQVYQVAIRLRSSCSPCDCECKKLVTCKLAYISTCVLAYADGTFLLWGWEKMRDIRSEPIDLISIFFGQTSQDGHYSNLAANNWSTLFKLNHKRKKWNAH